MYCLSITSIRENIFEALKLKANDALNDAFSVLEGNPNLVIFDKKERIRNGDREMKREDANGKKLVVNALYTGRDFQRYLRIFEDGARQNGSSYNEFKVLSYYNGIYTRL